ncbi:MAG: hypothetical protein ACYC4H_05320 [Desulfocucumaceae bacterium]
MIQEIKRWMEAVLEKPFYDAEMMRVEILKSNKTKTPGHVGNLSLKLKEIRH